MNSYLTVHDYLRATTGQETPSLLGNLMRLSGTGVMQGAVSLPVTPNTTVNLNVNDPITIFDGSNTEVVLVTTALGAGGSAIAVTAIAFAHPGGTSCCSDGVSGSLAEAILEGAAEVERICRQPLLQVTYNETVPLQSTRGWINSSLALMIRPRQSPVTNVAAITLAFTPLSTMGLNMSEVQLDSIGRIIKVPVIQSITVGGNTFPFAQFITQDTEAEVQFTYTAGFVYAAMPLIIRRAATLLTSDILSDRVNATGAAEYRRGKIATTVFLRGDMTGETANVKRARKWLQPYIQEAW